MWLSQAQFGKVQIVSKAQNLRFSSRLRANQDFSREHARANDPRVPLLESDSPSGARAPSLPSVLLHPQSQQRAHVPQFHGTSNTHD